jgi:hypothetical protein
MNWAELLLKNWFVVVIIFIIANRLFKQLKKPVSRSAPSDKPRSHKGMEMPPFGGGGDWSSIPGMSKGTTSTPKTGPAPVQPIVKEAGAPTSFPVSDFWEETSISDAQPQPAQTENQRPRAASNRLIQGVIWAEILGPPRSKKPFRK